MNTFKGEEGHSKNGLWTLSLRAPPPLRRHMHGRVPFVCDWFCEVVHNWSGAVCRGVLAQYYGGECQLSLIEDFIMRIIAALFCLSVSSTAFAQQIEVVHKDATGNVISSYEEKLDTNVQRRSLDNAERVFDRTRKQWEGGNTQNGPSFTSACEIVKNVLHSVQRERNGQTYLRDQPVLKSDRVEFRIRKETTNGGALIRVCSASGVQTLPDNAASPVALEIHGGWTCHDTAGQEETYDHNEPANGAYCD